MGNFMLAQLPEASFFSRQDRTKMRAWNVSLSVWNTSCVWHRDFGPRDVSAVDVGSSFWSFRILLPQQPVLRGCSCRQGEVLVFDMGRKQTTRREKYRLSIRKIVVSKVWWVLRWLTHHPEGCRMVVQKGSGSKGKFFFLLWNLFWGQPEL